LPALLKEFVGDRKSLPEVSDQELEAMVNLAIEPKDATVAWLQKFRPELLRDIEIVLVFVANTLF
jgi:hypothetical protein